MSEMLTASATCTLDGCDRRHKARGWCDTHYRRWQRHGDAGGAEVLDRSHIGQPCSVAGCDRGNFGQGYCSVHYRRWWRGGDPTQRNSRRTQGNLTRGADHVGAWLGDAAGYSACHSRVKALQGLAGGHGCAFCPAQAVDWAYDHSDPDHKVDPRGRPYSPDPARYMALCRRCHKRFDRDHRRKVDGDVGRAI